MAQAGWERWDQYRAAVGGAGAVVAPTQTPAGEPRATTGSPTDPIEALLLRIFDLLLAEVPRGVVDNLRLTAVTTAGFDSEIVLGAPSFSVTFVNDGPEVLEYRVPFRGNTSSGRVNPGEKLVVSFRYPVIVSVGVRSVANTTSVRIFSQR